MTLDVEKARKFLRSEFGINVRDDDPILGSYMLGLLAYKDLEPVLTEMASNIVASAAMSYNNVMKHSHDTMASAADYLDTTSKAVESNAEQARRFNDMLDEKMARMDERLAETDQRLAETNREIAEMKRLTADMRQSVVALADGLLVQKPRRWWGG